MYFYTLQRVMPAALFTNYRNYDNIYENQSSQALASVFSANFADDFVKNP